MIDVVLDALAVYRITRLVTADTLTEPMRERVIEAAYVGDGRAEEAVHTWGSSDDPTQPPGFWQDVVALDHDPPKLATLITCRWCAGMWVALGAVALRMFAPRQWAPLRDALAFSSVAALLAAVEDD